MEMSLRFLNIHTSTNQRIISHNKWYEVTLWILFMALIGCTASQDNGRQSKLPPSRLNTPTKIDNIAIRKKVIELEKERLKKPSDEKLLLELAAAYLDLEDESNATEILEVLVRLPTSEAKVYSSLASIYRRRLRVDEAIQLMNTFISLSTSSSHERARKELAELTSMKSILETKYELLIERLPSPINSSYSEYLAQFSADQQNLVFTRRVFDQEDLFEASFNADGTIDLRGLNELNTDANEGAHCLSADGQILYFTRCQKDAGFGKCDIYQSMRKDTGWSAPRNLGGNVNSEHWDAQPSLSADGKTLYFVSNRPGSQGGSDIWYSKRGQDGRWLPAVNAGPVINSRVNESAPFIHADGRTLYFQSDGHPGLGKQDIFMSRYDPEKGWSTPVNLAYPINTSGNEGAMVVNLEGTKGYYATDVIDGIKHDNLDIVAFNLPELFRPSPMTFIKGRITDRDSRLPLKASITVVSLDQRDTIIRNGTNFNGEFLVAVPVGKRLAIHIEKEDYLFYSDFVSFEEARLGIEPYRFNAMLEAITEEEGQYSSPTILNNLFFTTGSADLLPESAIELEYLVGLLQKYPDKKMEVIGHTDNTGSIELNSQLSADRASSVKQALINMGISENRIIAIGKGESEPIADNSTEEGRRKNRRVEFRIY